MTERIDVFISSTYEDLQAYREAVAKVILRLGMYPIDMSNFTATDRNALQTCYNKVLEAEIFVGIYAHRYGYIPDSDVAFTPKGGSIQYADGETSLIHYEYIWALKHKIPVLVFIISDNKADGQLLEWPVTFIDDDPSRSKLAKFKNHLQKNHVVSFFYSPDHLASLVAPALSNAKTALLPYQDTEQIMTRTADLKNDILRTYMKVEPEITKTSSGDVRVDEDLTDEWIFLKSITQEYIAIFRRMGWQMSDEILKIASTIQVESAHNITPDKIRSAAFEPINEFSSRYFPELLQALLSYQLPWGEWGDIGTKERLLRGERDSHISIQNIILKPNVARSMFALMQLQTLKLDRFTHRINRCAYWVNQQRGNDGWFYEWRMEQSHISDIDTPDLHKRPDIRHSAQMGTINLLSDTIDIGTLQTLERIIDSQLISGGWANDPNDDRIALFASAYCVEFLNCALNNTSILNLMNVNLISRCRRALDMGVSWFYSQFELYGNYFGERQRSSSYLSAMVLLRIYDPFFSRFPELKDIFVSELLSRHDDGTWVDERHAGVQEKELSRYPTTIRVLDLLAKLGNITSTRVVRNSFQFLLDRYQRGISEPPDLALMIECIMTIGHDKLESRVDDTNIYDAWEDTPRNTKEADWIIEYYNDWLERSRIRTSALENGILQQAAGYETALKEEKRKETMIRKKLRLINKDVLS